MGPPFYRKGRPSGSPIVPLKRGMVIFYRLSTVIIALSLTIRPQFAIECLRHSIQQGWVTWVKILGCSLWSKSVMLASAKSKHHRLTNREIIFGDFQPISCDHDTSASRTDGNTDRQKENRPLAVAIQRSACVSSRSKNVHNSF